MSDVSDFTILESDALAAMASPIRQRLLESLSVPDSASGLARRFDMSRQRIGYHMRDLERAGCIELAGQRQQRGLTEKLYRTRPLAFVSAPPRVDEPARRDRFAWATLVNLAARMLWHLVSLRRRADAAGKRLATLALEAEVFFDSPAERKAFSEALISAVEGVVRDHEKPRSEKSRGFRLVLGAYPQPEKRDHDRHPQHRA